MTNLNNTLYVTTQGAYLAKDGETVAVRVMHETRLRVPMHHLSGVVCFGRVSVSPELLAACAEAGVAVSFCSENGRFLARVEGTVSGNVLLRREQHRAADSASRSLTIGRCVVLGKVANSRAVLLRAARDRAPGEGRARLEGVADHLHRLGSSLERAEELEVVRGLEGDAAARYFGVFNDLLSAGREEFAIERRTRRPPLDPTNAMLSFGYTLLHHDCSAALGAVGLDPAVGWLHEDRPGRLSAALDLMEELRAPVVDRMVLTLINRGQVTPAGFRTREGGAVEMSDETRKTFLVAYQERKQEALTHPFTGEKVTWSLIPHVQARLLARHLRGDLEVYPPFLWR